MRLTTKIVAGIILSFFLLTITYIIAMSFTDRKDAYEHRISSESKIGLEVKPYKTVKITCEPHESEGFFNLFGAFILQPKTTDDEANKLFIPEELSRFVVVESSGDTLVINVKMQEIKKAYFDNKALRSNRLFGADFNLYTTDIDVISDLPEVNIIVKNIETDQIKLNTSSYTLIENCKADLVEPSVSGRWKMLEVKNSHIKNLVMDFDKIGEWTLTNNTTIEVGNFTGSKDNSKMQFSNQTIRAINWHPKSKDSRLTVTLPGDTARITLP